MVKEEGEEIGIDVRLLCHSLPPSLFPGTTTSPLVIEGNV